MHNRTLLLASAAIQVAAWVAGACDPIEVQKLLPIECAEAGFGAATSISGETAVVGAPWDETDGVLSGAAYVFTRAGDAWLVQDRLLPDDGEDYDFFGAVAINGDAIVVGAPGEGDGGVALGAAYVFERDGDLWSQQAKLLASDGESADEFGSSVAISGEIMVVGAPGDDDNGTDSGAAYVFVRVGDIWTEQTKLLPSDGAAFDGLGTSVSISDDTILVGAPYDGSNGEGSGSVYVFIWNGLDWVQDDKLLSHDGAAGDAFGVSVSLSGDFAVIGAVADDDNGQTSGSAYVFARVGGAWVEQQKLLASDGVAGDQFGEAVALDGDVSVVAAEGTDDDAGVAYVFTHAAGTWTEQVKIVASDAAADSKFGDGLAVDGDTAVIGASIADGVCAHSGAAYVFELHCAPACPGDVDGDGDTDQSDLGVLLASYGIGGGGDLDDDGDTDQSDLGILLADYGCGT